MFYGSRHDAVLIVVRFFFPFIVLAKDAELNGAGVLSYLSFRGRLAVPNGFHERPTSGAQPARYNLSYHTADRIR